VRAALAGDPDEKVTESVIEPLDVRQHAHRRMVLRAGAGVHAVVEYTRPWMESLTSLGFSSFFGRLLCIVPPFKEVIDFAQGPIYSCLMFKPQAVKVGEKRECA
jgi:hypothetical protein